MIHTLTHTLCVVYAVHNPGLRPVHPDYPLAPLPFVRREKRSPPSGPLSGNHTSGYHHGCFGGILPEGNPPLAHICPACPNFPALSVAAVVVLHLWKEAASKHCPGHGLLYGAGADGILIVFLGPPRIPIPRQTRTAGIRICPLFRIHSLTGVQPASLTPARHQTAVIHPNTTAASSCSHMEYWLKTGIYTPRLSAPLAAVSIMKPITPDSSIPHPPYPCIFRYPVQAFIPRNMGNIPRNLIYP